MFSQERNQWKLLIQPASTRLACLPIFWGVNSRLKLIASAFVPLRQFSPHTAILPFSAQSLLAKNQSYRTFSRSQSITRKNFMPPAKSLALNSLNAKADPPMKLSSLVASSTDLFVHSFPRATAKRFKLLLLSSLWTLPFVRMSLLCWQPLQLS